MSGPDLINQIISILVKFKDFVAVISKYSMPFCLISEIIHLR